MEYTRLDNLVDILFTTTQDVEAAVEAEVQPEIEVDLPPVAGKKYNADITDPKLVDLKRKLVLASLASIHGIRLIKKSRATYWTPDKNFRVASSISKRYPENSGDPYWFGYQQSWREFITQSPQGYFVLGCMDLEIAFAIPASVMESKLNDLGITIRPKAKWWHIVLKENGDGSYSLKSRTGKHMNLDSYQFRLPRMAEPI